MKSAGLPAFADSYGGQAAACYGLEKIEQKVTPELSRTIRLGESGKRNQRRAAIVAELGSVMSLASRKLASETRC